MIGLVACGGPGSPLAVSERVPTFGPTVTEAASVTPVPATPTLNAKELASLQWDETVVAIRTEVALTGVPTPIPGPPPPYTGPTPAPNLGLGGCVLTTALAPLYVTCWVGWYDGHLVDVRTGSEGLAGDLNQGILTVFTEDGHDTQDLLTPDKVGSVQITAVNGTLFTLTTVDHTPPVTYTFDLATRAWVTPGPSPVPSAAVSPVPSVSPVATQAP